MSQTDLASRQRALVDALVAGAPVPPGFDQVRVRAATQALLRKRASEVAATWPALRAWYGPDWSTAFAAWAADRPPRGSLRDGWDFARDTLTEAEAGTGTGAGVGVGVDAGASAALRGDAVLELARRDVRWHYDGVSAPRLRRLPAVRRTPTATVRQVAGRVWTWPR